MYIFITKDKKYVGMDNASGGYPYITDRPLAVHEWGTVEKARKIPKDV